MQVLALLREIPDLWVVKTEQRSIRGIPDLLICYKGKFVAWELKTNDGVTDVLQDFTLGKITQAGGVARVVQPRNLEKHVQELLDV